MNIDPVALVTRYHEALNRYDPAIMLLLFAETATYHSPGVGGLLVGRAAIISAFDTYFAEHSGQVAEDDSIEAIGTHSARSQWRLQATSKSTGARIVRRGREIVTFNDSGRILRVEVEEL